MKEQKKKEKFPTETYQDMEYEKRYSKKDILEKVRKHLSENVSVDYLLTWINHSF